MSLVDDKYYKTTCIYCEQPYVLSPVEWLFALSDEDVYKFILCPRCVQIKYRDYSKEKKTLLKNRNRFKHQLGIGKKQTLNYLYWLLYPELREDSGELKGLGKETK